jgi:glycosyltransferase involved in cell wall biosynthesis
MKRERPLVIVPAFNEQATIKEVVAQVVARNYAVLVVDDSSTDNTAELAASAGADVLRLSVNLGVGGALRAGFRYAIDNGFDSVVQIDGDGQHPAHQIADLEHAARTFGAHLVIGSRFLSSEATLIPSPTRRLSMWILSTFMTQLAGVPFTDTTSGFRLIRQPLLLRFAEEFPDYYLGDTFEATATALRAGYRVVEIPAALSARAHGTSSVNAVQAILLIAKSLISVVIKSYSGDGKTEPPMKHCQS